MHAVTCTSCHHQFHIDQNRIWSRTWTGAGPAWIGPSTVMFGCPKCGDWILIRLRPVQPTPVAWGGPKNLPDNKVQTAAVHGQRACRVILSGARPQKRMVDGDTLSSPRLDSRRARRFAIGFLVLGIMLFALALML